MCGTGPETSLTLDILICKMETRAPVSELLWRLDEITAEGYLAQMLFLFLSSSTFEYAVHKFFLGKRSMFSSICILTVIVLLDTASFTENWVCRVATELGYWIGGSQWWPQTSSPWLFPLGLLCAPPKTPLSHTLRTNTCHLHDS